MRAVKIREAGRENEESGRGSADNANTTAAVTSPDSVPDKIPSPENRTAAAPPMIALRYRAQRERGMMTPSGSRMERDIEQKTERSNTADASQTSWERRTDWSMDRGERDFFIIIIIPFIKF